MAAMIPTVALADDPNDPGMRTAAARAHDREITRQLNLRESAMVTERDARYAADAQQSQARATAARSQYERDMVAWRNAVSACRSGYYASCAR